MTYFIIVLFFLMAWWMRRIYMEHQSFNATRDAEAEWRKLNEKYAACNHELRWIIWKPQSYGEGNYYGLINKICKKCGYSIPLACGHGGSMYMDKTCYLAFVEQLSKEEQNLYLDDQMPFGE